MPDEYREGADQFWLQKVFPDAEGAFCHSQKPLNIIKDNCVVVLDANVLLLPYTLGSRSFDEISRVYSDLSRSNRIFIPGQAAREFVKNRGNKLRDVVRALSQQISGVAIPAEKRIGFLRDDKDYLEYCDMSDRILELKKSSAKKIKDISLRIRTEIGRDPVSEKYSEIFSGRICEYSKLDDEGKIVDEMKWRYDHEIPPGFRDADKFDDGIGDLVIWKTVIEIARKEGRPVLFVTEDAKGDWWVQSEGAFQARIELIEEFRRETGGETIHLLPLSELIELFGASEDAVKDTKITERTNISQVRARRPVSTSFDFRAFDGDKHELNHLMNENLSRLNRDQLIEVLTRIESIRRDTNMKRVETSQILRSKELINYSDDEISELFEREGFFKNLSRELYRRQREVSEYLENMFSSPGGG